MAELQDILNSGDIDGMLMDAGYSPTNAQDIAVNGTKVTTDPTGITGAFAVTNLLSISDADYQALGTGRPEHNIYFTELATYRGDYEVGVPPVASFYSTAVALGPLAYWRLGDSTLPNATEEIAANTGTYLNSPTLGVSSLLIGDTDTAVTLDGVDQAVDTNFMVPAGINATVYGIFKPAAIGNLMTFFGDGDPLGADRSFRVMLLATSTNWFVILGDGSTSFSDGTIAHGLIAGNTYHVAVVYSGADIKLYVNGSLVNTYVTALFGTAGAQNISIGKFGDDNIRYFEGDIDEFMFFDKGLTPTEISDLYTLGTT